MRGTRLWPGGGTDTPPGATPPGATRPELQQRLVGLAGFGRYLLDRFNGDQALRVAASLSYTSMLSLVPVLAIGLGLLAAFPVFAEVRGQIEEFIFSNFVPHAGDAVKGALTGFAQAAGQLTAVGIIGILVTAILLMITIESAFNTIFRVSRPRPLLQRLILYWTVITLGPLLIGASFSLTGYLAVLERMAQEVALDGVAGRLTALLPQLMTFITFSLLYMAVPNRPVRLRDALLGGLLATVLFALLRQGFVLYVSSFGGYEAIYGALSAVPIFLLWMYLSWAVVLVGAEITAALPEWRTQRQRGEGAAGAARLALALDVLATLLGEAARTGQGTPRGRLLALTGAEESALMTVLGALRQHGFVARTDDARWVVMRDLSGEPLHALLPPLGLGLPAPEPAPQGRLAELLAKAGRAERQALDSPIGELLAPRGSSPDQPADLPPPREADRDDDT
ncbi:virulence factor BrkB family protein [Roseospirillum parvum]|uniref:UPF0761 membrane protein SAMN05421742_11512 n=1 Tax=Roseospirillum parvum TaxID=83401 RepID=A0A1G8FN75_9PROT|nr:virulence factor BrkB family protein [Roseospirillum parvum]SDH83446.1 membrane protein [Roseospirillum parvum]